MFPIPQKDTYESSNEPPTTTWNKPVFSSNILSVSNKPIGEDPLRHSEEGERVTPRFRER